MTRDHTDWRQVFLIFVIGLLAAGQFGKVSLNFDLLRETYARPDPELALIVSGVGVMGIVFGAVAGMGVARFGARRVLLWALGVAGALSLMQASLPSFWPLIGLRVIEGGAHLALVVASPVLVAGAAAPRDRPVAMALWASFFGVSFA
ncbi:MAG: MFS transporter, partial [Roseicyclus sp.]